MLSVNIVVCAPRYCGGANVTSASKLTAGRSRRGKVRGVPASRSLHSALNNCDDTHLVDFVSRCLDWDPASRISAPNAVHHAWFKRRQDSSAEPPVLGRRPSVTLKKLVMSGPGDSVPMSGASTNHTLRSKLPHI